MGFAGVNSTVTLQHMYSMYKVWLMNTLVLSSFRRHIVQVSE